MNRELMLKLTRVFNWVTAGLMLLLLASFALPFFEYPAESAGAYSVISIWGYLGFPSNFPQMKTLMDVKFLTIAHLNVVLILIVTGIISMITLLTKKGLATQLFPLIWTVYGTIGYAINGFLRLGNTYAYFVQYAIIIITLIVVVFNIVLYVKEMRSRPAEEYLDLDAWSTSA